MKKIKLYSLMLPVVMAVLALAGCEKDDGPIKNDILSQIDAIPVIATTKDPTGSASIDLTNLAAFQGKFSVSMYFPNGIKAEKVDVIVRKNASSNIRVFQANVTAFPAAFTVTAAQIQTLFGQPIALGDNYDFSVDVYANGKKYEAYPLGGLGTGPGPTGMPGYSYAASYGAICAYNSDLYQGDFIVISDEWADYKAGDVVQLTKVSANQFSFKYLDAGALPIIVTVSASNETSVAKQVYAPNGYGTTYGPFSCESIASADNKVAPCDQTWSVRLKHTVTAGSFGDATIKMKKK